MTLPGTVQTAASRGAPELSFSVEGAEALRFAAGPTIEFLVRVAAPAGVSIRSLSLNVQIRVAATRRAYDPATRRRLFEVFGRPEQWARSVRSVVWTQTTLVVPAFDESVEVKLPVPCTYDLEVAAARYLHA